MTSRQLAKLQIPDSPGVYTFRDAKKRPLYIGRATSLRDRVKSYFGLELIAARGSRIVDMVTKARTVTWQATDSVLEAILLESELIKRYQPFYNVDERDDKSSQYVIITNEPWPRVFLARARDFDQLAKDRALPYKVKKRFGPYPESGLIKEALKILRKLFPFRDRKAHDPHHEEFYRSLGQSPRGQDDAARAEYQKTIQRLIMFFEGKKRRLKSGLARQMKIAAKGLRFEDAGRLKRLIYALDHINDMALLKRSINQSFTNENREVPSDSTFSSLDGPNSKVNQPKFRREFRMEAYDVAHLSGMENVGVMVVSVNGQLSQNEYRKFKISRNRSDDIAGLIEILSRRLNHSEWLYPDLIIVDGNEVQLKHAEAVLSARRIAIPIVAVTKDEHHKAARLIGLSEITKKYKNEIIALNAEAHRFAIAYHRQRRRKGFTRS